jgi:hypothetical protein
MTKILYITLLVGMLFGCSSVPKAAECYGEFKSLNPDFQYTGDLKAKKSRANNPEGGES